MGAEAHHARAAGNSRHETLGIVYRTTPLAHSWTGDMRVRFSDFQVNEISKDGEVLHLRTIGLGHDVNKTPQPALIQKHEAAKEQDHLGDEVQKDKAPSEPTSIEIASQDVQVLEQLVGSRFTKDLMQLFNGGHGPQGDKDEAATSDILDDKAKRAQIHGEVRRIFQSRLETSTNAEGAIVTKYLAPRRKGRRGRAHRGQPDDEPLGQYLHFTLYKDNRDTMDAVNQIARLLRIKPQSIAYAGTKDRRASTTQRCSVRHQRKRAMAGLNGKLWGISTGDYDYRDEPIHLGQLLGNEFVITLKNCKTIDEDATPTPVERLSKMRGNVTSAVDHMATHGWLNYFGHQRFGTHDVGTHQIGRLILKNDFEGAVQALLHYDPDIAARAEAGDVPDEPSRRDEHLRHQACMLFLTGKDTARAAAIIPRRYAGESCVLRHLARLGQNSARDFAGAITHITRGLRSMYLHAYQSYVWNHAANHRFALHGTTVIKGDLVISDAASAPPDQDDDVINPSEDGEDAPLRARPLTDDEARSGTYTIHDIVLPSPGYDVVYPDNETGKFYVDFMGREENGCLDPHKMRRLRREFSLPGRYRKLMQRFLGAPEVRVRLYENDAEQMHPTDMDVVNGRTTPDKTEGKRKREGGDSDDAVPKKVKTEEVASCDSPRHSADTEQDGLNGNGALSETSEPTKVAVVVKFQLASSAYATVALREMMGDGVVDEGHDSS